MGQRGTASTARIFNTATLYPSFYTRSRPSTFRTLKMSGTVTAAHLLLLLLGVAFGKQTSLRPEARVGEEEDESHRQETKMLMVKNLLTTEFKTEYQTMIVYPTCTATVDLVTSCLPGDVGPLPEELTFVTPQRRPALTTQAPGEDESSSLSQVEMVLPSCDCIGGRAPRRLLEHQVITFRSTTTLTESSVVTRTDPSTTVSITYGGCVPTDAPLTVTCPS